MEKYFTKKNQRPTSYLIFIKYIESLKTFINTQHMNVDLIDIYLDDGFLFDPELKDPNNPYHTEENYKLGKAQILKLQLPGISEESSYEDIISVTNLVFDQLTALFQVQSSINNIVDSNLSKTIQLDNYMKEIKNLHLKSAKLIIKTPPNKTSISSILKLKGEYIDNLDKYYKGCSPVSNKVAMDIIQSMFYILSEYEILKTSSFRSRELNQIEWFKYLTYGSILIDFITLINPPDDVFSKEEIKIIIFFRNNTKKINMYQSIGIPWNKGEYFLSRDYELQEMWAEKIKHHAPLPETIDVTVNKILEGDVKNEQ